MVSIRILSIDSIDSSPCVAVITDNSRFLFNVGEGIQRLCVEYRIKVTKIDTLFITKFCPSNISGIPGLSLTLHGAGKSEINVVSPKGFQNYWDGTQYFMKRSDFHMRIKELDSTVPHDSIKTQDLIIHPITIASNHSHLISYVCQTPELTGKFDIVRANKLNIPKGKLFGILKSGLPITLDNGIVIQPEQVLGVAEKSRYFMIMTSIDTSDLIALQNLSTNQEFIK